MWDWIDFAHQSLFTGQRQYYCIMKKVVKKPFVARFDKLPQVMSLESASGWDVD